MKRMNRGAFAQPGTSLDFNTGNWRDARPLYTHAAAPCHGACPAGEDPQAYLAYAALGDFERAWHSLVEANPLPAITGRVCHHPCETGCNRGQYDEAVAIHSLERQIGDEALKHGWNYNLQAPPQGAKRLAVVGAGPAGLSAAYHALANGMQVTLFESTSLAGGLLRSAIPPYRLPHEIVDQELERLLALPGIEFRPHQHLGRDIHLDELKQSFDHIFLGVGTQKSTEWTVDGARPGDLHNGLAFLEECIDVGKTLDWHTVAIVGAGNTAIDLARVLIRFGIPDVHVISHKAIPGPGVTPIDTMPAIPREIVQAIDEGVVIHEHQSVERLILRGGRVVGLELVRTRKLDYNGELRRTQFEGTETVLDVDHVIPAIGQQVAPRGLEQLLNGGAFLHANHNGQSDSDPSIYTGGDARGDHGMVSEAIGDGRRAVAHMLWQQEEPRDKPTIRYESLNPRYFDTNPRVGIQELAVKRRLHKFDEIEQAVGTAGLKDESRRCFSCGQCMHCDNCWQLCPDAAVLVNPKSENEPYVIDYDYCKGCGICAHECPTGYIVMRDETDFL